MNGVFTRCAPTSYVGTADGISFVTIQTMQGTKRFAFIVDEKNANIQFCSINPNINNGDFDQCNKVVGSQSGYVTDMAPIDILFYNVNDEDYGLVYLITGRHIVFRLQSLALDRLFLSLIRQKQNQFTVVSFQQMEPLIVTPHRPAKHHGRLRLLRLMTKA